MISNIDIPNVKTNFSRPSSRLNSNNDIFERDVQVEYKYNSPKSPGMFNIKGENDMGTKTEFRNPFLMNSPRELSFKYTGKDNESPMLNKSFSFDVKSHSDNQISKVPTHVLSLDDYITSDMDEKCYISTVHKHCRNGQCRDCKKFDNEGTYHCNKDSCDDFAERMDYFNHKESTFDRYMSGSVPKLGKNGFSNGLERSTNFLTSSKEDDLASDATDIDVLTVEAVGSIQPKHSIKNETNYLSKEEMELQRLNRERSKSLTSIIVKGLSNSCK